MKLNRFDSETRIYTHSTDAVLNPLKEGEFFEQAFSTADALPDLKSNEVAVRNVDDTEWLVLDDFRGTVWNTETKSKVDIITLGPLPKNVTNIQPQVFDEWDGEQWVKNIANELQSTKAQSIQSISSFAASTRQKIAGAADHYQTAGWSDKRARAMRIKQNIPEADDIVTVQREVDKRAKGETVLQLIELQLGKSQKFAIAMSDIDGMQAAAEDQINAVTNVLEIPELLTKLQKAAEQQVVVLLA